MAPKRHTPGEPTAEGLEELLSQEAALDVMVAAAREEAAAYLRSAQECLHAADSHFENALEDELDHIKRTVNAEFSRHREETRDSHLKEMGRYRRREPHELAALVERVLPLLLGTDGREAQAAGRETRDDGRETRADG